jgi:hypothetical protein
MARSPGRMGVDRRRSRRAPASRDAGDLGPSPMPTALMAESTSAPARAGHRACDPTARSCRARRHAGARRPRRRRRACRRPRARRRWRRSSAASTTGRRSEGGVVGERADLERASPRDPAGRPTPPTDSHVAGDLDAEPGQQLAREAPAATRAAVSRALARSSTSRMSSRSYFTRAGEVGVPRAAGASPARAAPVAPSGISASTCIVAAS